MIHVFANGKGGEVCMADEQPTGGMLERLRNSPRTVSTIIVILIIAGAIFAFSDRGRRPSPSPEATETAGGGESAAPANESPGVSPVVKASPVVSRRVEQTSPAPPTPLPQPTETAEAYTEVAEKGNGMTHLARKATARYLQATPTDFQVTNEHRIFMEDYVKDQIGRQPLRIGETRTISKDLIRDAVDASKQLTDAQLKNLQKYSQRVRWP